MSQVEMARMTWKDARAARDRGAVVLIPIGTLEQNGSVSPLGTDILAAEEISRRVARETGAVAAPCINYGYSAIFRSYPGTVTLSPETLRQVILEVCQNLIENGFERLMMVNCHVPNEPIMEHAARDIREKFGILVASVNPITLAQAACKDLYAGAEATLGHGAEPIASMLRSFDPESVRLDAAEPGDWSPFQGFKVVSSGKVKSGNAVFGLYFSNEEAALTGGSGDPSASDPERGVEIMRRVVALVSGCVKAFAAVEVKGRKPII